MAQPVEFPESNLTLYPPAAAADQAVPLHVRASDNAQVSCWEPSESEMLEILRTRRIWAVKKELEDGTHLLFIAGHKVFVM